MDGTVSISVGALMSLASFLFQMAVTGGVVLLAYGSLKQRVSTLEEKLKERENLSNVVTRLDAEIEAMGREIKGLREDFRRVLDEFARVPRSPAR